MAEMRTASTSADRGDQLGMPDVVLWGSLAAGGDPTPPRQEGLTVTEAVGDEPVKGAPDVDPETLSVEDLLTPDIFV